FLMRPLSLFRPLSGLLLLAAMALPAIAAAPSDPRPPETLNAAAMRKELEKRDRTGSVLYSGAHPDDENTAFLAWASSGRLARTAYLSLTRGDGGQNLIG